MNSCKTWEQRKLEDLLESVQIKNSDGHYSQDDILACSLGTELNKKTIFYGLRSTKESVKSYRIVNINDVIYTKSPIKGYPNGIVRTSKIVDGIVPSLYCVYQKKRDISMAIDTRFIQSYLEDKNRLDYYLFPLVNVGARNNVNITDKEFLKGIIKIPICIEEQIQIVEMLEKVNHLITLHQRKLDKLINVKKSMLEKMFPKQGSTVPEIRFNGFTQAWEQRKLSDIYQNIGNAFVGTATPYYVEQGHFYLESNNIKNGQINHNSEVFINNDFYERQKDKWLHTGDMVMVQSGHVGHAAVIPEKLDNSAAHALIMFRNAKVEIEPYLLNYQYQTSNSKKKIDNITTGNTIKHILASDMKQFTVDIPSIGEQQLVANYFIQLDELITLHQRKLEKLKNIKKSMLEKMFV